MKVSGPVETDRFANVEFKTTRGSDNKVHEFSLADLPCLNPYRWIILLHFLLKDEKKYKPLVWHIKWMLISYLYEVAKLDIDISSVFSKKPTVLPIGKEKNINKIKMGKIEKDNWTMMFHRGLEA